MRISFANILATLLSCILIVVFIALCYFYDEKTGTINLTNQEFYTQEEMDSNYDKGYQAATTNQSVEKATLLAQIDTLTSAKNSVESELTEKNELLEEYQLTNSQDKQTIVNLENEITRLNSQIAILEADIEYYIEQLNQVTTTVTATFYLNEDSSEVYYTKVLNSGDTLLRGDVPAPQNTTYLGFVGWYSNGNELTSMELIEDTVFYGKWETIAVDAIFVGFDDEIIESKVVGIGEVLTAPEPPLVDGYKFTGWSPSVQSYII
ncbi:MAG: hypothetical protein IJ301_01520 [Clostridia bacterium]|nr:hypothetical protein [Clostridia bacterium]